MGVFIAFRVIYVLINAVVLRLLLTVGSWELGVGSREQTACEKQPVNTRRNN